MGGAAAHRKCRKWIATAGWFAAAKYLLYGSQGTAWQTGSSGQRAPQFTVNKVAQAPSTKTKRNEWGNKIRDLEEGTFSTAGEDNHHHDNANQASVEGHAAVPDTEKIQRIGHKLREIVEQNITNTSTEEDAEEARIE